MQKIISQKGNTNTVLIVVVLLVLVGFVVWYFTMRGGTQAPAPDKNGVNIDVTLPEGSSDSNPSY